MHDDASWMLSRIPIASSRSWKRVNDEFFTDYTVSMFELVRTTLAPRLSFILNIHLAEFSTLFRYSLLPAIAMESRPDNNLIVPNLSVIFMYIDRFCRYCCRRSVYFCFPFFFFFFNIVDIFVLSFRCRSNYPLCLLDIGFYAVCVRTRYIHLA